MMTKRILVINFGSTSSKLSIYEDGKSKYYENVQHDKEKLKDAGKVINQLSLREKSVYEFLKKNNIDVATLTCIVTRCSCFTNLYGAYEVSDLMIDRIMDRMDIRHAGTLSCLVGYTIGHEFGIPVYIYSFNKDEMKPECKLTGIKGIERPAAGHAESWFAAAEKAAASCSSELKDMNMIVAHMGGGISSCLFSKGAVIDCIGDSESHFSPERAGGINSRTLVKMLESHDFELSDINNLIMGSGGLYSHLGTADLRTVEGRIIEGDTYAKTVYEAMSLQVSKSIAMLAVTVDMDIDRIVLTGGLANSDSFVKTITKRVEKIAPVMAFPGDYEMDAFAMAMTRVLEGKEKAVYYDQETDKYSVSIEDKK